MSTDRKPVMHCAIYTRKSSEEVSSNPSTHSTRSVKLARHSSSASDMKVGSYCMLATMMVDSPVAPWSDLH
jgi:hypothetical protein